MKSFRPFLAAGSCSAAVAVIAGAFGAHALKAILDPEKLAMFETGVRYQMYHALALLGVAVIQDRWGAEGNRSLQIAGVLFILGTILFSGSLYVVALAGIKAASAATPIGGIMFITGWIMLASAAMTRR